MAADLRQQNLDLKRQLNEERAQAKRLNTRLLKMQTDLKSARESCTVDVLSKGDEISSVGKQIRHEQKLEDFQQQVLDLQRVNTQLKMKLTEMVHGANGAVKTVKAGSPYDHVVSRVDSNNNSNSSRRLVPLWPTGSTKQPASSSRSVQQNPVSVEETRDEVLKLQMLVNVLRSKLQETDQKNQQLTEKMFKLENQDFAHVQDSLLKSDADRITLQKQFSETSKEYSELRGKYQEMLRHSQSLEDSRNMMMQQMDSLNTALREGREREIQLEHRLATNGVNVKTERDLQEIINDLRKEKDVLIHEHNKLTEATLNNKAYMTLEKEILDLRQKYNQSQEKVQECVNREKELIARLEQTTKSLAEYENKDELFSKKYRELQKEAMDRQSKLDLFMSGSAATQEEIEEALALIRLRRQKGFTADLDFLNHIEELYQDKLQMEELQRDHAKMIQDIDTVEQLLKQQKKINEKVTQEKNELVQRIEQQKMEFDRREAERTYLIDALQSRVARLEGKLREVAHGQSVPLFTGDVHGPLDEEIQLLKGQNLLEIQIEAAEFNREAIQGLRDQCLALEQMDQPTLPHSKSCDFTDPSRHLVSFITFDFFDFAPQVTPLALGLNPQYQFTARFKVTVDDFFLDYLSSKTMSIEVWRNVGGEFYSIGRCQCQFVELLESATSGHESVRWLKFSGDIFSSAEKPSEQKHLGKLFFAVRARVPMNESARGYRERSQAIRSLEQPMESVNEANTYDARKSTDTIASSLRSRQLSSTNRYAENRLQVWFGSIVDLNLVKPHAAISLSFSFFNFGDFVTPSFPTSTLDEIKMNCDTQIVVKVTKHFDDYLAQNSFEIMLMGEDLVDGHVQLSAIGSLCIPLILIKTQSAINLRDYPVMNESGEKVATVHGEIKWQMPYEFKVTTALEFIEQQRENTVVVENAVKKVTDIVVESKSVDTVNHGTQVPAKPSSDDDYKTIEPAEQSIVRSNISIVKNMTSHVDPVLPPTFEEKCVPKSDAVATQPPTPVIQAAEESYVVPEKEVLSHIPIDNVPSTQKYDTHSTVSPQEPSPFDLEKSQKELDLIQSELNNLDIGELDVKRPDAKTEEQVASKPADIRINEVIEAMSPVQNASHSDQCVVRIDAITFLGKNQLLMKLQKSLRIKQFFCSYEFLNFPVETLETPSMIFPDLEKHLSVSVNFARVFDFQSKENMCVLTQFLQHKEAAIHFTLVSEPPDGASDAVCVDFATAKLDIGAALDDEDSAKMDMLELTANIFPNTHDPSVLKLLDNLKLTFIGTMRVTLINAGMLRMLRNATKKDTHRHKIVNQRTATPPLSAHLSLVDLKDRKRLDFDNGRSDRVINQTRVSPSLTNLSAPLRDSFTHLAAKHRSAHQLTGGAGPAIGSRVQLNESPTGFRASSTSPKPVQRQDSQDSIDELFGQMFDGGASRP